MLKQFIADLGGPEIVAAEVSKMAHASLNARAVYQWHYDHTIPHRWRFHVAKLAKKRRLKDVPPEIKAFMQ